MKLIKIVGDKWLYMMPNDVIDLSHFVELTELGRKWVDRLKEIEAEALKAGYQ